MPMDEEDMPGTEPGPVRPARRWREKRIDELGSAIERHRRWEEKKAEAEEKEAKKPRALAWWEEPQKTAAKISHERAWWTLGLTRPGPPAFIEDVPAIVRIAARTASASGWPWQQKTEPPI
jgi:hypothetical protein